MTFLSRILVITLLALGAAPVWAACQEQQASPSVDDCKKKEEQAREAMAKEREEERRKVRQICEAHKDAPIPPEDLPTGQNRQELEKCASGQSLESGIFYAGVTVPPDYVKARKCAYLERESDMGWPQIGGAARLLQIYARGRGIPKNMNLAVRFACEWGEFAAQAELESLISGLMGTDIESRKWLEESGYSVCSNAISGRLAGGCSYESLEHEKLLREVAIIPIKAAWSKETMAAYANVYEAAERFFSEEATFYVYPDCQGCTGGISREMGYIREKWPEFYDTLKKSGLEELGGQSKFRSADKELNLAYRELIRKIESHQGDLEPYVVGSTLSFLKKAQLSWIRYRDAFERFGETLTPPISYKTYLTNERAKGLRRYTETFLDEEKW